MIALRGPVIFPSQSDLDGNFGTCRAYSSIYETVVLTFSWDFRETVAFRDSSRDAVRSSALCRNKNLMMQTIDNEYFYSRLNIVRDACHSHHLNWRPYYYRIDRIPLRNLKDYSFEVMDFILALY